MQSWLFTSGTTRGTFTALEPNGETRECVGVELVLGVQEGPSVGEALTILLTKLTSSHILPSYLYQNKNVIAYEITGSDWVNIKGPLYEAEKELKTEPEPLKTEGYIKPKHPNKLIIQSQSIKKPKLKDELSIKIKNSSLEEIIDLARKSAINEEIINKYREGSLGLAKMHLGNLIRKFNGSQKT